MKNGFKQVFEKYEARQDQDTTLHTPTVKLIVMGGVENVCFPSLYNQ